MFREEKRPKRSFKNKIMFFYSFVLCFSDSFNFKFYRKGHAIWRNSVFKFKFKNEFMKEALSFGGIFAKKNEIRIIFCF